MLRNLLTVLILSTLMFMTGCQKKPTPPYVEFNQYNDDVLPKLDEGYVILKHESYTGPKNMTKDSILKSAKDYKADLVMVNDDFGIHEVSFDIYYLKKPNSRTKTQFGAKFIEMPLHIRQNFNSNLGCTLGNISYGSLAYEYDLHKYDVITKANGKEITSCKQFSKILSKSGYNAKLNVWADGETYEITIKRNKKQQQTNKTKQSEKGTK